MAICYRIFITITNVFFPPLAVIFLTGFGADTLINSLLFLAAIIPSHIHGFYLSCTYFHRRRKVRKGRWPGGPKPFIHSENVIHGGARWDEVERLKRAEFGSASAGRRASAVKRASGSGGGSRRGRANAKRGSAYEMNGYGGSVNRGGGRTTNGFGGNMNGGSGYAVPGY